MPLTSPPYFRLRRSPGRWNLPASAVSNDVPPAMPLRSPLAQFWTAIALVLGLATAAQAGPIALAWDPSPDAAVIGYIVIYGTVPGEYTHVRDVGNATTASFPSLVSGQIYYFVVQAYTASG